MLFPFLNLVTINYILIVINLFIIIADTRFVYK